MISINGILVYVARTHLWVWTSVYGGLHRAWSNHLTWPLIVSFICSHVLLAATLIISSSVWVHIHLWFLRCYNIHLMDILGFTGLVTILELANHFLTYSPLHCTPITFLCFIHPMLNMYFIFIFAPCLWRIRTKYLIFLHLGTITSFGLTFSCSSYKAKLVVHIPSYFYLSWKLWYLEFISIIPAFGRLPF